jgi:adenylate cyclase
MRRLSDLVGRALSLADMDTDDDDLRLRKRIGVGAGYLTALAVLTMPVQARGHIVAIVAGGSMFALCVFNLALLARSRRFERFVVILAISAGVFVSLGTWLAGGVTLTSSGLVWAFLVPAVALLALGPTRVGRWYVAFIAVVAGAVTLDLIWLQPTGIDPYPVQLVNSVFNTVASLSIVFAMLVYSDRRRREAEARSEALLTNAIPASIASRLKRGETTIADLYPETTVLFADLAEFTPWAQRNEPARIASVLDDLFRRFDGLVAEAGMEKIKTIGDSYMAVSGAPQPSPAHADEALAVALRMLGTVDDWRRKEDVPLAIRIGLASGPVVGGVIGEKRILFDLWGDTVNTAARMESTGVAGRIQIAESTRRLLGDDHSYEERRLDVKGLGERLAYLVGGASRR